MNDFIKKAISIALGIILAFLGLWAAMGIYFSIIVPVDIVEGAYAKSMTIIYLLPSLVFGIIAFAAWKKKMVSKDLDVVTIFLVAALISFSFVVLGSLPTVTN
ncbi:MAG: hypothetical protein AABW99_00660 [archaeon]